MNVGELREVLDDLPDEMEILVAADPEGNEFRPLTEVAGGFIWKEDFTNTWVIDSLADPDEVVSENGEYDDNEFEERLVLWP